ncbi:MAG: ankyrin repeat domain-containing protein, partial [Tatlockia sp.]|nr:ankyrin repeat domain-containing protein [Tatlockia sp.]
LEAKDKCGNTPLNLAAQRDTSLDIIKQLLNSKAHIATIDNDGVNPLFYASAYGHTDTVRLLIDAGANVDAQEPKGNFSPLHVAAQNGHITIVELLLSKGARTEVQTNAKETPLHSATSSDHKSIVELLVAKGATIDVQNKDNCTPLYSAIRNGSLLAVKLLIDKGADINALSIANQSLLYVSLFKGHEEIVQWLLDKGIKVVNVQETSTMLAPLHLAAQKNYITAAKSLLDKGAAINIKNINGQTPLHLAIENNHPVMAELLIAEGADINAKDSNNCTPLDLAVKNGSIKRLPLIELFLRNDASVSSETQEHINVLKKLVIVKRQALFKAIELSNYEIVNKLLKEGFALNTCDKNGNTLLHKAVQAGNVPMVTLLVSLGASKYLAKPNVDGITPIKLMLDNKMFIDVVSPLLKQ